ncbi:MAG TPA: FixH family protein [Vicinamibacterales bacterium]
MHVRLAAPPGGRRLTIVCRPRSIRFRLPLLILLGACSIGGCGRTAAPDVTIEWSLSPTPPRVGPSTLTLHVRDSAHRPVSGASLKIEGHMSHPGMAPVVASASERGNGAYEARLEFTMRGDWILLVGGTLPDGARIEHRIDVRDVQPSG